MSISLTDGIACVLDTYGRPVGTGFVVSNDGLIATCVHIISELCPELVTLVFQAAKEQRRQATILPQYCGSENAEDIAILRLVGDLPTGVLPLPLGPATGTRNHRICTFGFPNTNNIEGIWGQGTALGLVTEPGGYLLQLSSSQITQGFSGAPIWDESQHRVIGMVVKIAIPDRNFRQIDTAFAIPTETLRTFCPLLQISEECPYRNLDTFTEADARFFFGRTRAINEMVDSLRNDPRSLAVLGPSGSGKSSAVQAGLIPKLRQGAVPSSDRWEIIVTRPSDRSFFHLIAALDQTQKQHIALVIDQFEELLVVSSDEAKLQDITTCLARLHGQASVSIILTLRDDFYSRFAEQAMLVEWLKHGLVNMPPTLTQDELTAIVQEPARVVGLSFEEGLVEMIVKNAMEAINMPGKLRSIGRSTILPLLEFTLTQLWERREEGMLTHDAYQRVGGVTGSLTQWAGTTFSSLDEHQQRLARRILTDLVHLGELDLGIPDSRRPRELVTLFRHEEEREDVSQVVEQFVTARLLIASQDAQSKRVMVEIIHDALLLEWGVFRQWIEQDRRYLMWHQELERAVQAWIKTAPDSSSRRDRDKLLRGRDLLEAESWLESYSMTLSRTEKDFIEASREQQEQEEQRWKELYEKSELQRQALLANQLANQAKWIRDQQTHKLQLSMLLAIESIRRSPSSKADKLLREGLILLPLSVSHLTYDKRVHSITLSPNGQLLAVANGGNFVEIYSIPNAHKIAQLEHDDCVWDVTFSPDCCLLATASRDHGVRIWSVHGDKIAQLKHDQQALTVTFSSDGLYLATTGLDYTARLWSIKEMQELVRFEHRTVATAAFSPDSRYLAVGSDWIGEALTLFELSNRQYIPIPPPDRFGTWTNHVTSFVFSPDGRYLVIVSYKGTAVVCDLANGMELTDLEQEGEAIAVAFSPDGKYLASTSDNGMVQVWRAYGKNAFGKYPKVRMKHNDRVEVVIFNSDGTLLATASDDQTARVWEVSSGKQVLSLAHEGAVRSVIFSQDERYLVTASNDGTVRIWDTKSVSQTIRLTHAGPVGALSFNSDGTLLATASDDQTAKIWKVRNGSQVACLTHEAKIRSVAFNPADNNVVVTASKDGTARVWNASSGSELACLPHKGEVWKVIFSSDGRYFATSGRDQTARVWKASNNRLSAGLLPNGVIEGMAFSSDGHYLATTSYNTLRVLDIQTSRQLFSSHNFFDGHSVSFSPNGRYLATASGSNVKVWDIATGNELRSLKHDNTVWAITFSPDGRYLSTAGEDCTARVWDSADGSQIAQFTHKAMVWDVKFSPKGSYLATASWDCTACVWDILSGRQIACFTHKDRVIAVAFSPDGKYLATASDDHTVRIWLWQPNDIVTEVCSRLTRNLTPEEWKQYIGDEPYRKTCPSLP